MIHKILVGSEARSHHMEFSEARKGEREDIESERSQPEDSSHPFVSLLSVYGFVIVLILL
jgi:hypothetical protein